MCLFRLSYHLFSKDELWQLIRGSLDIPPKFEESVQGTYNAHCIGYSAFEKKGLPESEALFDSPGGKGSGVWGLNLNNPRLKR